MCLISAKKPRERKKDLILELIFLKNIRKPRVLDCFKSKFMAISPFGS